MIIQDGIPNYMLFSYVYFALSLLFTDFEVIWILKMMYLFIYIYILLSPIQYL